MMISPQSFIENLENKEYEILIKEKNKLIDDIKRFEENKNTDSDIFMDPSPEVIYQCNLLYLSELCKLIHDKFNKRIWEVKDE